MTDSITIHHLDDATLAWLYREAERRGVSVEMLVRQLITQGVEAEQRRPEPHLYHDLDALAGTWSEEQAVAFLEAVADFDQVDEKLWQ